MAPRQDPVRRIPIRLYDEDEADALDDWLKTTRKRLGRKIDASRLMRELLREVITDPGLTARIHERLQEQERPSKS